MLRIVLVSALLFSSLPAFADSFTQVWQKLASESLGRALKPSEAELIAVKASAVQEKANRAPLLLAADDGNAPMVKDYYGCVGFKVAFLVGGWQGLRCASPFGGEIVTVHFNANIHPSESYPYDTGVPGADGYVGLTIGAAIDVGLMIIEHPSDNTANSYLGHERYDSERSGGDSLWTPSGKSQGMTVNGGWGLFGALIGVYVKAHSKVYLIAYQPGYSAELGASDIVINSTRY